MVVIVPALYVVEIGALRYLMIVCYPHVAVMEMIHLLIIQIAHVNIAE